MSESEVAEASIQCELPADAPADGHSYAIVEIFGHRRLVGRVFEVERFGTKLLRIDLPKDGQFANGYTTQFYGGASIFSFTPCTLATAEYKPPTPAIGHYQRQDDDDIDF